MNVATERPTIKEVLARMDDGWAAFSAHVHAVPNELLEARIGEDEWTRKQMLAHIVAWHDLTSDRLIGYATSDAPVEVDEEDVVNARAARAAEGRTTGEILLSLDESFRRLRREVARLSSDQVAANEGWAARVIAGNTFGHYVDHLADLESR